MIPFKSKYRNGLMSSIGSEWASSGGLPDGSAAGRFGNLFLNTDFKTMPIFRTVAIKNKPSQVSK
jgi:hypothetical protein